MQSQKPELLLLYGITSSQIDYLEEQLLTYEEVISESHCDRSTRLVCSWRKWLGKYKTRLEREQDQEREKKMNLNNPKFILRNHILKKCIELTEKGDFFEVNKLLALCQNPYENLEEDEFYYIPAKEWKIKISCSS